MLQAKIITDSEFDGVRLVTFEVEFHRFILPEINTHRVFSRNYQSSRAVPVKSLIEQVRSDPAMPVHWGKNQSGMVAEEELNSDAQEIAEKSWRGAALEASIKAERMDNYGAHKQVVNRLLEPFMWTRGVITATAEGFESFSKLRCHPDAQPEIQALAFLMRDAMELSEPTQLKAGDWHMPYFQEGYWHPDAEVSLADAVKISTSCVAQVSYRKLDDSLKKAAKIYDMLNLPSKGVFSDNPPHFSPAEHCARAIGSDDYLFELFPFSDSSIGGNFNTTKWYQYRKMLEQGTEANYFN